MLIIDYRTKYINTYKHERGLVYMKNSRTFNQIMMEIVEENKTRDRSKLLYFICQEFENRYGIAGSRLEYQTKRLGCSTTKAILGKIDLFLSDYSNYAEQMVS